MGKDIGIISYNEIPFKEIVANGIATISTDFEQKIADRVREADSKIDKVYVAFVNTGLDNMNNNNNVPGVDKNDKMYRDDEKDNNRDPEDIVEDPKDMMDRNNKDQ